MPDTIRKELRRQAKVSETTIHGWPAVFFSLPFMGAGIFIILVSLNVIPTSDSDFHVSRFLVAAFGLLFFFAGLYIFIHGLIGIYRRKVNARCKQERPSEIWYADYTWDKQGIKSQGVKDILVLLWACFGIIIFVVPFVWLAFFSEIDSLFMKGCVGFVAVFIFLGLVQGVKSIFQQIKYGESYLQFNRFPFLLGDKVDATFITRKKIEGVKTLHAVLRCVEEKYELRGSENESVVISYQLYAEDIEIENIGRYPMGQLRVPLIFSLPEEQEYQSCLSARPAKYWELELTAKAPGINYQTRFLLPIYARI